MITHTFGCVNRGAAWQIQMSGWNDISIPPAYQLSHTSKWVVLVVRPRFELDTSCIGGSKCITAPLNMTWCKLHFQPKSISTLTEKLLEIIKKHTVLMKRMPASAKNSENIKNGNYTVFRVLIYYIGYYIGYCSFLF